MHTKLTIPVLFKKMGIEEVDEELRTAVEQGIQDPELRLKEIVGALINIHKSDIKDTREVREKFADMTIKVSRHNSQIHLYCTNVPVDCLYDGRHVIWESVEQISAVLRDVLFSPLPPHGNGTGALQSAWLKRFAEHSGFLYRGERRPVAFTWGGHRVPYAEYDFAKDTAYWATLAVPELEHLTGCGAGIMKAPFKGAVVAYAKQRTQDRFGKRYFNGFTERNILAAEPPNEMVNRFVVFPTIEARMEAFVRASHMGKAHPGGPGTIEEILTMLAVLSDPANKELVYPFDLVEREGGTYFRFLDDVLTTCFKDELKGRYTFHPGAPSLYAERVEGLCKKHPPRYLWNDDLHFDPRLQHHFEVTFKNMESLDLTRNQSTFDLLVNMRRFFSSIVHLSVKDPDMLDSWGTDRPLIKGDTDVLQAVDRLVGLLEAQDRIHPDKKYSRPYRIS